jgi:hypothetical protein
MMNTKSRRSSSWKTRGERKMKKKEEEENNDKEK